MTGPEVNVLRCGWCGTDNPGGTNCTSCGGPLPPPPDAGAGPLPPTAPRDVPDVFVRRVLYRNPDAIFALVVTIAGVLITLPFLVLGVFVPPLLFGVVVTGFWPAFGVWALVRTRRKGKARLDVLQRGRVAAGKVTGVQPNRVTFVFEADGQRHAGTVEVPQGYSGVAVDRAVHVLYLPEAPDRGEVWPLLG